MPSGTCSASTVRGTCRVGRNGDRRQDFCSGAPAPATVETVELGPEDAADLAALYGDWGWWADRDADDVAVMLDGTDVALGLCDEGDLVASGRALTDGVYYATRYDVIVAADRRGEGLGRRVVAALRDHPAVAAADHVELLCDPDLVEFYERCGFEENPRFVEMVHE
jgi:GNAT superfamily N-acetyltransferase